MDPMDQMDKMDKMEEKDKTIRLEEKLKRLVLRGPSARLDRSMEELFLPPPAHPPRRFALPRTLSWRWGLALAGLAGLIGYLAGAATSPVWAPGQTRPTSTEAAAMPKAAVVVTVEYHSTGENPFDCTRPADDGLKPGLPITISYPKESRS